MHPGHHFASSQQLASDIERAVTILREGGLVAFPTETVYGLGADASNPEAVAKIFKAKGRPQHHPVIVHIANPEQMNQWTQDIPSAALKVANKFWPGPLTLILKRKPHVSDIITGGQDTIGLRVPAHPVAQRLLKMFGGGIAAPSANKFSHISATTAQHVREEFGEEIDCILDGGMCDVGIESTILDLSRSHPVLLRPGRISATAIATTLDEMPRSPDETAPRAPGRLEKHYAPRLPVNIVPPSLLNEKINVLATQNKKVAVLARQPAPIDHRAEIWRLAPADSQAYAHDLYVNLRALDKPEHDVILIEAVPIEEAWDDIADRLKRASGSGPLTTLR